MKIEVKITESFRKAAKPLIKKYKSFLDDLSELESDLTAKPETGVSLGNNIYKIRLKIKSKGKGKSGGARIISYLEKELISLVEVEEEKTTVNLLTVYDKSARENITDAELKNLIESLK